MSLEDFKTLIEIQSIEKSIKTHLDNIQSQKQRIEHIISQRKLYKDQISSNSEANQKLTDSLSTKEKELYKIETQIERSEGHLLDVKTEHEANALAKELENIKPKAEELQELALNIMEEIEILSKKIEDGKIFLDGSKESLQEINIEVDKIIEQENREIENYNKRISILFESVPGNFKSAYLDTNNTFIYNNPLSFVEKRACTECRYAVPETTQKEVELGNTLDICPGCGRLLTPLSAATH